MSSSFVVSLSSFNLLFFTQVLTVLTSSLKYHDYVTDKGKNVSIPCLADGDVMWVKEDPRHSNNNTIIQTGRFLVLTNVTTADRGLYVCFASVPPSPHPPVVVSAQDTSAADASQVQAHETASERPALSTSRPPTMPAPATYASSSSSPSISLSTPATAIATRTALTTSPLPADAAAADHPDDGALSPAHNSSSSRGHSRTTPLHSALAVNGRLFPRDGETGGGAATAVREFEAVRKFNLTVRTPPGPVTQLYFKASTILGFLIWRFNKTYSGGYAVRSFTAEYRNVSYARPPYNSSFEHAWSRMDPVNIAPNVRQMEVYHLEPNTTYEFRIWANNYLGKGEVVTTNVTTLPETKEEDLIRLIQADLDNFDPRIWIAAVVVVLGTLVILAIGLCVVLTHECYQSSQNVNTASWEGIELIPNIILNPGFCDGDGERRMPRHHPDLAPYPRTVVFSAPEEDSDYDEDEESDHEPAMEKFKRKVSVFFTGPGPTIKRM